LASSEGGNSFLKMAEMEYQISSDELVTPQVPNSRAWRQRAQGAGVATIVLLLVAAVAHGTTYQATEAAIEDSESLVAEVDSAQANFQAIGKESDHCAALKKDCSSAKCCKITGYRCIKGSEKLATCAKTCPKKGPCTVMSETMTFDTHDRTSLFCFSVYTENTGSSKPSHELELLSMVLEKKASIFACDKAEVYGDVAVSLGGGVTTIKVEDVEGDFHFAKRKHMGTWINTGMYKQIWKAVGKEATYAGYDWTVKADADAVFFPAKLVARVHLLPVPPSGTFLINCEGVKYGFFGNLEVISKTAFSILAANIDTCDKDTVKEWKVGLEHGKHGPMGEDLFAEMCMRKNGVTGTEVFDVTKDGCCAAKRPGNEKKNKKWKPDCASTNTPAIHPFKKPEEYKKCMEEAEEVV
jgi:hypothetical protein